MKTPFNPLIFGTLVLASLSSVHGQSSSAAATGTASKAFDMTGFPQWSKDLRRFEIVAFGSFPFAMFLSTTTMDLYRSAAHDWDARYRPWPLKPAGAVALTTEEHLQVIGGAAAAAVLVAAVDFLVVHLKRLKAERAAAALPSGSPIIIRQPWPPEEGDGSGGEVPEGQAPGEGTSGGAAPEEQAPGGPP